MAEAVPAAGGGGAMSWDPDVYLAFASDRFRPVRDLVARVTLERPARIVDLGCGTGDAVR